MLMCQMPSYCSCSSSLLRVTITQGFAFGLGDSSLTLTRHRDLLYSRSQNSGSVWVWESFYFSELKHYGCLFFQILGKKNKLRVYYLSWLRNKILRNDPEVEKRQGWVSVGDLEGCVHYKVGKDLLVFPWGATWSSYCMSWHQYFSSALFQDCIGLNISECFLFKPCFTWLCFAPCHSR